MATDPEPSSATSPAAAGDLAGVTPVWAGATRWILGLGRVLLLVGVFSLLSAAAALLIIAAIATVGHIASLLGLYGEVPDIQGSILASIKLVDVVLIAAVLQVVGFGIYSLLVDPGLPLPRWLRTGDPEELKTKLASIIVLMLAVLFLEEVIEARSDRDLLPFGLAIAAIIGAVTLFIRVKRDR